MSQYPTQEDYFCGINKFKCAKLWLSMFNYVQGIQVMLLV
jgi:hypothetical protein